MVLEFEGSNAKQVTAMLARKSSSGSHDAPPFVVFQMPPATAAAYITSGLVGSISKARVRPPTLPGPNDCHVPQAPPADALPSPAPPPPVPFGNSPSSSLKSEFASPVSKRDGKLLFLAVEKRFICLIFSFAWKWRSIGNCFSPFGRRFCKYHSSASRGWSKRSSSLSDSPLN